MSRNAPHLEVLATAPGAMAARGELDPAAVAPARTAQPMPAKAEILHQLERMLASDAFDASARNRAFLRYVVNETLAGRADHIKGYTVAQEVFQRDVDFDPQLDPVVRIEASRVRRSLERYYLTAGKRDRLLIRLPKGGYVPCFALRDPDDFSDYAETRLGTDEADGTAPSPAPFVIVRPFESRTGAPAADAIAPGLADELIGRLTRCEGLKVLAENPGTLPGATGGHRDRRPSGGYVLQGSTRRAGRRLRVSVQLVDALDGRYLWVQTFDHMMRSKNVWTVQEELADTIAQAIAGPTGALAGLAQR
jgi:TolB-like protein